jgi:S-ribosylhomocysteine lyase LuxS involved in autoinducer biosynthesis
MYAKQLSYIDEHVTLGGSNASTFDLKMLTPDKEFFKFVNVMQILHFFRLFIC